MMQFFRDHAQGVIGWILFIFVSIAFGLVGIQAYLGGNGKVIVASVDDIDIPLAEYQQAYQQERAFRRQLLGDRIDPAFLDEEVLKQAAMKRVVDSAVLTHAAREAGLRISDRQLARRIRDFQQFQTNGQFDQALYIRLLGNQGLSEERFEEGLRSDLLAEQLLSALTDASTFAPAAEVERLLALRHQQRRIGYLVIDQSDYVEGSAIEDAAISDYYEQHKERFALPEKVSVNYLELSAADLYQEIPIDEAQLRRMYNEQADAHALPEERQASHILIQVDEDASQEEIDAARDRAADLLRRIRAGESFADLAREYSDDPGSAANGGDLGYFARGVMTKPFEDAVFAMKVGEVSDLVRSPFGFHIIKLTDVRAQQRKPFAEVRDALASEYRERRAEEAFFEQADRLADLTFEHPESLARAAEELGLSIQSTAPFERNHGTGIASDPHVREVAFSDDVLEAGNNSEPVMLADNHVVVLHVKTHQPPSYQPLAQARPQIISALRAEAAQQRARKAGEAALARLRNGTRPEQLAGELHSDWKTPDFIERRNHELPAEVVKLAFRMARPEAGQVVSDGVSLPAGYALVSLFEVRSGELAELDDKERDTTHDATVRRRANRLAGYVLDSLKGRMDVKEYPDRL